MPQGLRTGALYTNNFDCPLEVSEDNFGIEKTLSEGQFNWYYDTILVWIYVLRQHLFIMIN
jgi:hypothetical protein